MLTILNLFGRSPFAPLQSHMERVSQCVHKTVELFDALQSENFKKLDEIANEISELEHQADLTKNDIRNHLPRTLYLAIDRNNLLEILAIQDSIADSAEDIAALCTLKILKMPDSLKKDFKNFLLKNIECFNGARNIIKELHDLLESSFGGIEAEKVRSMVDDVSFKEHEADVLQHKLLKDLYAAEDKMSYGTFHLWQKIFAATASISNLSEKLANRVRMNLDLK
jgi:predicted phosphate transport protein (TIGR00153 family)